MKIFIATLLSLASVVETQPNYIMNGFIHGSVINYPKDNITLLSEIEREC